MDANLIAFTVEILATFAMSALILILLQPVLRELLKDLCRGATRADFWVTFTRLMIFIAPMIVVVLFTKNTGHQLIEPVAAVRASLLHALVGQFVGLALIGAVILHFSLDDAKKQHQPEPHGVSS